MFWTIRWTDSGKQEDRWVVLEAESQSAAEAWGWKRGVPVISLAEATPVERAQARKAGLLRKYTPEPKYVCCGRPVGQGQLVIFMLLGVATACVNLRPFAGAFHGWF
jgi:hypothetical protein